MSEQVTAFIPAETMDALEWALDQAHGDQDNYLSNGNFSADYGDEWPETARTKAEYSRKIADLCIGLGWPVRAEQWLKLAIDLEESADIYRCKGCGRLEEECSPNPCAGVIADRKA